MLVPFPISLPPLACAMTTTGKLDFASAVAALSALSVKYKPVQLTNVPEAQKSAKNIMHFPFSSDFVVWSYLVNKSPSLLLFGLVC